MELDTMFRKYLENRNDLINICNKSKELFNCLGATSDAKEALNSFESLNRENFKVLVVGEFKRGKSTFINALIGEEVLPAYATPCTAVINEIKYSEEKKAVLHFINPFPKKLECKLSKDVQAHINKYKKGEIPPLEIPVDRIEEFVVIKDYDKDQSEAISESPFSLVEIFWPLDLCKNRIEIIDSPGLNEHGTRTKVTTDYLSKVDAIIFVLSCSALCSQSELQTISESITAAGHEEIFFVCNRFDEVRERERPRVVEYAKQKLSDKTKLENGIHFLSAINALDGKLDNNNELLNSSGLPELEKNLATFLVYNRGRIKLLHPSNVIKNLLKKTVRETIPIQKTLLAKNLNEILKKYDSEKPMLEQAEKKKFLIRETLNNEKEEINVFVRKQVKFFLKEVANSIPDLINKYESQYSLKFFTTQTTKTQCINLTKDLLRMVEADLSSKQQEWLKTELVPAVQDRVKQMISKTEIEIKDFLVSIDRVWSSFGNNAGNNNERNVSALERISTAALGLLISGPAGAFAVKDGLKNLLPTLLPQTAVIFASILLGLTNPLILIASIFAAGSIPQILGQKGVEKKLREKLGSDLRGKLLSSLDENSESAVENVNKLLQDIITEVDSGLSREIDSIKQNIELIIEAKNKGENEAKQKEEFLSEKFKTANELIDTLDKFSENL